MEQHRIIQDIGIWALFAVVIVLSSVGIFAILAVSNSDSTESLAEVSRKERVFHHAFASWVVATTSAAWSPRDSAASFVFNDRMWTMGGLNGNAVTDSGHAVQYWDAVHYNDIWSSEDGRYWTREIEHASWSPRRSMSVAYFNDSLWMVGGWSPIQGYTREIWKSADGVTWEKVTGSAPWSAREGQSLEVFHDTLWLIGGVNYDERKVFNDVWYSHDGVTWTMATSSAPWRGRWDHATTIFNDKLYLTGGMDLTKQSFNDVWVSTDGIAWELLDGNPPWTSRQGHSLLVAHGALWLVSRLNDAETGGENDMWYSLDGTTWHKTVSDPPWLGREDHGGLVFRDRLFIFGGMDSNWVWRNDVWHSN